MAHGVPAAPIARRSLYQDCHMLSVCTKSRALQIVPGLQHAGVFPNHCRVMFPSTTHRVRLLFDGGVSLDGARCPSPHAGAGAWILSPRARLTCHPAATRQAGAQSRPIAPICLRCWTARGRICLRACVPGFYRCTPPLPKSAGESARRLPRALHCVCCCPRGKECHPRCGIAGSDADAAHKPQ